MLARRPVLRNTPDAPALEFVCLETPDLKINSTQSAVSTCFHHQVD